MRLTDVIANRKKVNAMVTRVPCMIYENGKDRGTICVLWPYSPDLLTVSLTLSGISEKKKNRLANGRSIAILHNF